jgi:hypothetical protein
MGELFLTDFGPIDETAGGGGASAAEDVTYAGGPGLTATDVEAALDELAGLVGTGGATVIQYTVGGTYDLADFTDQADARVTYGTGTPQFGAPATVLTGTVVQHGGMPTVWEFDNLTQARWFSPEIPVALGDLVRVSIMMGWNRTANSLSGPEESIPSLVADDLYDQSGGNIRVASFVYAMDGDDYVSMPYTDTANTYSQAWLMDNDVTQFTNEIVVLDPATTTIQLQVGAELIWSNVAGVVTLHVVRFEIVPAP